MSRREVAVMVPLMALMLLLGLYPKPLLSRMEPSVTELLGRVRAAEAHNHGSSEQVAGISTGLLGANR